MIKVEHITKKFGSNIAVDDISFEIEKGEIVGFLGPNGAGKTTTMNIITGSTVPTSGSVIIDNIDISKHSDKVKRKIGYMPEQLPLYMDMTVKEYLKFVCNLKKVNGKETKAEIERVVNATGLSEVTSRLIRNLSRGYKQRVGIAQSLVGNPELLILDEPTVGLDPNQIVEIRSLIKSLAGDHTVILSTHILPEVEQICNKVIIIKKGKIVSNGKISDISKTKSEDVMFEVITDKDSLDIFKNIEGIKDVKYISEQQGEFKYCIKTLNSKDIRKEIFRAFDKEEVEILELHKLDENLENIFVELTR